MPAPVIGQFTCPLCRSPRAKVSLSKASLPVVTCSNCHTQIFARSDRSDRFVRDAMRPLETAPPAETVDAPKPDEAAQQPAGRSGWDIW